MGVLVVCVCVCLGGYFLILHSLRKVFFLLPHKDKNPWDVLGVIIIALYFALTFVLFGFIYMKMDI